MRGKRSKYIRSGIIAIVVIIVLILLLLRSCGRDEGATPLPPIGDFEVTDTQSPDEERPGDEEHPGDESVPIISFAVQLKYEVSEKFPEIELRNPEENFVDFVFELTDVRSGELIARTGRVPAGKYVYVNIADFYPVSGVYDVACNISTYDAQSGTQMNGLNQTVEVVVKK